jgi:uncharacterized protein YecE (DUF72 family)
LLYLGTSGYSFPHWKGVFYPGRIRRADWLRYYALKFNSVEINSTYYRILSRETTQRMADSVPEGFSFSVKLHSSMTHSHNAGAEEWKAFLNMLEPFRGSGRMGMVLAQFPWSFPLEEDSFRKLRFISKQLAGIPAAAEFRHARWYGKESLRRVEAMGFAPVSVDMPQLDGLPETGLIGGGGSPYLRLHGRNGEKWWGNTQERYDYLYSREELQGWAKKLTDLSASEGRCYVFFNNCHMGSAALNAADMRMLLCGEYGGR